MIRHRLFCSLEIIKQNKPLIYIKNKSVPIVLQNIRPFLSSINCNLKSPHGATVRYTHSAPTDNSSPTFVPERSYANADSFKQKIVEENKGKAGVYR
jgi:hypothetical protein